MAELSAAVEQDKLKQQQSGARARELEAKVRDIKGHRERSDILTTYLQADAAIDLSKSSCRVRYVNKSNITELKFPIESLKKLKRR